MESSRWQALERYVRFLEAKPGQEDSGCRYAELIPQVEITDEDLSQVLDLACEIQQVQSPTFDESERAAFIRRHFERLELNDIQIDEAGNLLARVPGNDPNLKPIIFSAHLDTVFPRRPELSLTRLEDRICGPGIGDNSLSLAAMVFLTQWLKRSGRRLPGDIWLAANVCEEGLGDLRGMKALVNRFGSQALAYIIIEGMGFGTIYTRGLGVSRYRIQAKTPGGHSWSSYGTPSAVHEISRLVARLADMALPGNPRTTLNVGVISGGTTVNTIASQASIELDLRSVSSQTLGYIEAQVKMLVENFQQKNVEFTMESIGKREAGEIAVNHPLVEVARCVVEDLGFTPKLDIGSTDANVPLSRGLPAICIGLTHGAKAHTLDEYILTAPVRSGLTQLLQLAQIAWVSAITPPGAGQ